MIVLAVGDGRGFDGYIPRTTSTGCEPLEFRFASTISPFGFRRLVSG
jgi:hypothetical protein